MMLTHRPFRDGSPVDSDHVSAYLALELATHAFNDALAHATAGQVGEQDVMIAHITSNYSRELLVGEAEVEVTVEKIGRTSISLDVTIEQFGQRAAVTSFVLVRVLDGRACPLTDAERGAIESSLQKPSPGVRTES